MTIPNDKLEQHHLQQLSALKDGELAADEARFLLRRLQHDDELKARWDRWHVVGEALRGDAVAPASSDFAARVGQAVTAVAAEPMPAHAGREFSRSAVLRWGGALAASVAALALFVGMPGELESIAPITAAVAPSVESLPEQANAVSSPDVVPAQVAAVPQQASAPPAATVPARRSTRQLAASGRSAPLRRVDGQRTDASSDPIASSIMVAEVPPQNEVVEAAGLQNPPRPAARPWPRSVLQGGEGAYQAGYMTGGLNGNTGSVSYFTGQTALPLHLPESSSIEPDEEPQGPARE